MFIFSTAMKSLINLHCYTSASTLFHTASLTLNFIRTIILNPFSVLAMCAEYQHINALKIRNYTVLIFDEKSSILVPSSAAKPLFLFLFWSKSELPLLRHT